MKKIFIFLSILLLLFTSISCQKTTDPFSSILSEFQNSSLEETFTDFSKEIASILGNSRDTFILDDYIGDNSSYTHLSKDITLWGQTYKLTLYFANDDLYQIHLSSTEETTLSEQQIALVQTNLEQQFPLENKLFKEEDQIFKITEDVIFTFYRTSNSQHGFIYLCSSSLSQNELDQFINQIFTIGKDVSSGLYYIQTPSPNSPASYFISNDRLGVSYSRSGLINNFAYILVSEGEFLFIQNGTLIPADQAPLPTPSSDGTYGEGQYLIGRDIPAGKYKIFSISTDGLASYYLSSTPYTDDYDNLIKYDILTKDVYLDVSDGQYLTVTQSKFCLSD